MTRKKNNFSTDYIIRNIEDQARQRNLIDGATQAPLWFNTPPPMIRGSDKRSGAYVGGKEPERFIFPVVPLPQEGSLEFDFDANRPGTGNVPTNHGNNATVGDLTLNGSGYTYEAAGGPNGHAAFRYTGTGRHEHTTGGGTLIQEHNITLACLIQNTDVLSNRVACAAVNGFGSKPRLGESGTPTTFQYVFGGSNKVPAVAISENTQWDVLIWNHQQSGANQDTRAWHAVLDSSVLEAMTIETTAQDVELGTKVDIGGYWGTSNRWHGRIIRFMAWTELVDEQAILDYLNAEYGADSM